MTDPSQAAEDAARRDAEREAAARRARTALLVAAIKLVYMRRRRADEVRPLPEDHYRRQALRWLRSARPKPSVDIEV